MELIVFIASIYAFLETAITGYFEYTQNKNKGVGILLYILAIFCLIAPNVVI